MKINSSTIVQSITGTFHLKSSQSALRARCGLMVDLYPECEELNPKDACLKCAQYDYGLAKELKII